MAALIRHGLLVNPLKSTSAILAVHTASVQYAKDRYKRKKPVKKTYQRLEANKESLATRGFLRSQKEYVPPYDVSARIDRICTDQNISTENGTRVDDLTARFKLFVACEENFNHSIPNSVLYSIETIDDLKQFYETPVDTRTPLDAMRSMDLPKNLHIRHDYLRFHPDTDTMFDGKTAFPKSSTLVTGLKYKKKYPGHKQEDPYLHLQLKTE